MKQITVYWNKIEETTLADIKVFFFWFYFRKKLRFHSRGNPFRKSCYCWERTIDGIDVDDIGNVEDSPRLVFIHEECKNLIVVSDCGKLTTNIKQKKKSGVFQ